MDKDFELLWQEVHRTKQDEEKNTVDVNKVIGEAFREYRHRKGYNIKQLAEQANMDASTLSNIENGRWSLTTKRLQKFVDETHCDIVFKFIPKN